MSLIPGNDSYFIFGIYTANIGDHMGVSSLVKVGFFLGSDCCIDLSTLGYGLSNLGGTMVLFGNGGAGWAIKYFSFNWCSVTNFLLVYRYVGSDSVRMCYMVVASLHILWRHDSSCMEDYFRWCGIFFLSASAMFAASEIEVSSGVTVGFVMYLCLKTTVPENLVEYVLFTSKFQHR